jgi:tRNA(adenine34) deaminase
MQVKERFMKEAIKEALKARKKDEVPIGAVIVKEDKIIARGYNLRESKQNSLKHAEIIAIDKACKKLKNFRLENCDLYVTVEPCLMCAGAIGWAQVQRVVYGASDEKRGFTVYAPKALHPKCTVSSGVLEAECRELMQSFFAKKRGR